MMKKIAEDLNKIRVLDENGALVAYYAIVPAHDCTVIYLTSEAGVEITVAEHLEEYIYDNQ